MLNELKSYKNGFEEVYGTDENVLAYHSKRFSYLIGKHTEYFGEREVKLFSTPGRTELGGNHTDHNHGLVLASSINLDSVAVVSNSNDNKVIIYSEGYATPFAVDLNNLSPIKNEKGSTNSLIRGIAARFSELGHSIGGFKGVISSDVLPGSGLSSSASIEVLICTIFNVLFNSNSIPIEEIAKISQYAENFYFGKPCGLMDQMASAVGGIVAIDFKDPSSPILEKVDFDFEAAGYNLVVLDTGGNHANLTDDYTSIPNEMKQVASYFGKTSCREINLETLMENISDLRSKVGDRALLRAIHFLIENKRVVDQVELLRRGNFEKFLELIKESGDSSFKWLQNIYSPSNVEEQGITLALALTENYIDKIGKGVCRVHGGGFAGTIQAFLPNSKIDDYQDEMERVFGRKSLTKLIIRKTGTHYFSKSA